MSGYELVPSAVSVLGVLQTTFGLGLLCGVETSDLPAATAMSSNQLSPSRATGSITCEPDRAIRKDGLDGASAAEDTVAEPSVDETDYYDAVGYAPPAPWQEAHDALQQQIALDNRESDSKDSMPQNVFADIGLNHDSWIQSVLPPGVYATSMNFAPSPDGGIMTPQQRQRNGGFNSCSTTRRVK